MTNGLSLCQWSHYFFHTCSSFQLHFACWGYVGFSYLEKSNPFPPLCKFFEIRVGLIASILYIFMTDAKFFHSVGPTGVKTQEFSCFLYAILSPSFAGSCGKAYTWLKVPKKGGVCVWVFFWGGVGVCFILFMLSTISKCHKTRRSKFYINI